MRIRLGGFVLLPRLLDKARAEIAGTHGDYRYNCPLDQEFFGYVGVDAAALRQQLAKALGDWAVLQWIQAHSIQKRTAPEIAQWSASQEGRGPSSLEKREWFQELHRQIGPHREDVCIWADLLDLDDYVSFGGRPWGGYEANNLAARPRLSNLCRSQQKPGMTEQPGSCLTVACPKPIPGWMPTAHLMN